MFFSESIVPPRYSISERTNLYTCVCRQLTSPKMRSGIRRSEQIIKRKMRCMTLHTCIVKKGITGYERNDGFEDYYGMQGCKELCMKKDRRTSACCKTDFMAANRLTVWNRADKFRFERVRYAPKLYKDKICITSHWRCPYHRHQNSFCDHCAAETKWSTSLIIPCKESIT